MSTIPLRQPVDRRATPSVRSSPDCLEPLRLATAADQAMLVRRDFEGEVLEVVGTAGVPFLELGGRLPLDGWAAARAAVDGRDVPMAISDSDQPLDRLMAAAGLTSARAVGLRVGDVAIGALVVAWSGVPHPVGEVRAAVASCELQLLQGLLARPVTPRRVLVCHDQPLVAEGVARTIERRLGATATVVTTVGGALRLLEDERPDLIVFGDRVDPDSALQEVAQALRAAGSAAPLLVLAQADTARTLDAAHEAGASGYVPIAAPPERLVAAVAELLEGCSSLPHGVADVGGPRLTDREHQVLAGFDRGLSDKELALKLGVTVSTVKSHARGLYSKLEASSRTQALHKARCLGLI